MQRRRLLYLSMVVCLSNAAKHLPWPINSFVFHLCPPPPFPIHPWPEHTPAASTLLLCIPVEEKRLTRKRKCEVERGHLCVLCIVITHATKKTVRPCGPRFSDRSKLQSYPFSFLFFFSLSKGRKGFSVFISLKRGLFRVYHDSTVCIQNFFAVGSFLSFLEFIHLVWWFYTVLSSMSMFRP